MRSIWLVIVLLLGACSSGPSEPVPDVVGERLDAAIDDVEDAGFETEVLGGGAFGVIDESGWLVCDQDPGAGSAEADVVELTVDRSCETEGGAAANGSSGGGDDPDSTQSGSAAKTGKAKFRTSSISWEAHSQARLKVMFTVLNTGNAAGRPSCFVEVDATDVNDECFGECGAQEVLTGRRLEPGQRSRTFGWVNIQGGAAPAVYDVRVLC